MTSTCTEATSRSREPSPPSCFRALGSRAGCCRLERRESSRPRAVAGSRRAQRAAPTQAPAPRVAPGARRVAHVRRRRLSDSAFAAGRRRAGRTGPALEDVVVWSGGVCRLMALQQILASRSASWRTHSRAEIERASGRRREVASSCRRRAAARRCAPGSSRAPHSPAGGEGTVGVFDASSIGPERPYEGMPGAARLLRPVQVDGA